MKHKLLAGIISAAMVTTMAVTLTACGNSGGNGNGGGNDTTDKFSFSSSEVFGLSASTTGDLLSTLSAGSDAAATAAENNFGAGSGNKLTDEQIAEISKKLAFFESYIGSKPVEVIDGVSDKAEYAHMQTISTTDLLGNKTTYILYYNQSLLPAENDDDDNDLDFGEIDLETEQNFTLDGILVSGDVTYTVVGQKEIEEEADESEYEIFFKASIDANNYVMFQQETELEGAEVEEEFKYTIYADGKLVQNFSIEFESEAGEQKVKLKSSADKLNSISFSEKIENGKRIIKMDFVEDGVKTSAKVHIIQNANGEFEYKYFLNDGSTKTNPRGNAYGHKGEGGKK